MSVGTCQQPASLALDTSITRDEGPNTDRRTLERASLQTATSSADSAHFSSSLTASTTHTSYTAATSVHSSAMPGSDGHSQMVQAVGQPETTIIELISTSATASAFPETFGLTISQKGKWIAAYTSTALYILRSESLPQVSGRFFRLRRKPVAMAISDDPHSIAILSNPHNVDVYSNHGESNDDSVWSNLKQRSIIFGHEIFTITLSPDANILAAGYRGGVEIVSVAPDAQDNQRRQVSCEPMAEVAFSADGRTLITTSTLKKTRPTTIITVGDPLDGPITDDGVMDPLPPQQAWISQLLFPERATHARQAALLSDSLGQVNELFAYNAESSSWGIYDLTMKRFSDKKVDVLDLLPSTRKMNYETAVPAVSSDSAQIAIATKHATRSDVLIYRLPYTWKCDSSTDLSRPEEHDAALPPAYVVQLSQGEGAAPESIMKLSWLGPDRSDLPSRRLIALTTSTTHPVDEDLSAIPPAASGRIILMDLMTPFRPSSSPRKVIINFDELPEEVLGDDPMDFEREVSILRSRTQVQRRRSSNHSIDPRRIPRASTALGTHSRSNGLLSPSDVSEASLTRRHSLSSITSEETETSFGALVLDEPYSPAQPRSQFTLQRAATISAQSGASRRHLRALPNRPLEYRRADGLREMPHESDADNWVPPPPPYTREIDPTVSQPLSSSTQRSSVQPLPSSIQPVSSSVSHPLPNAGASRSTSALVPGPHPPALVPGRQPSTLLPGRLPPINTTPFAPSSAPIIPEQTLTRPSTTSSTASALPSVQQIASLDRRIDRRPVGGRSVTPSGTPPQAVRCPSRVQSYDLNRPLPPLPDSTRRPRGSRLANLANVMTNSPIEREDQARAPTAMSKYDEKRRKRGTRCVVM